ncbi:LOW QUALITY PROTEIN: hypothetical protein PHMEG_00036192 [Phytophthora megakarya]|uniref:Uncharacterized protein n=1 Tax=Phytophthora megakarya TaxID=4795 RepID=A0A225UMH3_9STRA|nr:LOW QUALITY PROTEIN: hypothetical protein PHMEG_00036192 [Phytophthora megakarya]
MELIRLVREAGMIPGSFDADTLFDLDLDVIQATSPDLFQKLNILVGEVPQSPDPLPLTTTDAIDNLTVSYYASAAEDGSDTSSEPPRRMSLGPSGASMLEARSKIRRSSPARYSRRDNGSAPTDQATVTESSDRSVDTLQKFFNAAIDRYLAEEREANKDPAYTRLEDHKMSRWNPFDLPIMDLAGNFPTSAQATVATAAAGSTGSTMIQRVRISAISDLKVFTGKDQDEDRARAWISKAKSAFMRDQASDDEKCLTFADRLAGPRRTDPILQAWSIGSKTVQPYATQIRRVALLVSTQCGGTPSRLKIKDGNAKERREHVDHYIETLEDQDLAERLTLLRLTDADDLEEVPRARDRAKNRQKKAAFGSSKYRRKPTNSTPSARASARDPDPS